LQQQIEDIDVKDEEKKEFWAHLEFQRILALRKKISYAQIQGSKQSHMESDSKKGFMDEDNFPNIPTQNTPYEENTFPILGSKAKWDNSRNIIKAKDFNSAKIGLPNMIELAKLNNNKINKSAKDPAKNKLSAKIKENAKYDNSQVSLDSPWEDNIFIDWDVKRQDTTDLDEVNINVK